MKNTIHHLMILVVLALFLISTLSMNSPVNAASSEKNEWSVVLTVSDEYGTTADTITFGEKHNASDMKGQYDIPKPPPFQPGIRITIPTNFAEPYDYLWREYKNTNATEHQWNLSILWFSMDYNNSTVTLSWNQSDLAESDYQSVGLYKNDVLQINMLESSSYQYQASSNIPTFFTIQGSQKDITDDPSDNGKITTNDTPGISVMIILALIVAITLLFSFKKGKL